MLQLMLLLLLRVHVRCTAFTGRDRSCCQRLAHALLDVTLVIAASYEALATFLARKGTLAGVDSPMNCRKEWFNDNILFKTLQKSSPVSCPP